MTMVTKELVTRSLPKGYIVKEIDDLVDTLNNIAASDEEAEHIRNNFLSFTSVLTQGKFRTYDYVDAIKYVSFKLMGLSNIKSYVKAFPDRYQRLVAKGTSTSDIGSYVSAYHRTKLVNLIMEQAMIPTWLLNQDLFQKALNVQAEIMSNPQASFKARSDAANSILTHLKRPEQALPSINIDMRESSAVEDLKNTLASLAQQQMALIQEGVTVKAIAEQDIIDGEINEVY